MKITKKLFFAVVVAITICCMLPQTTFAATKVPKLVKTKAGTVELSKKYPTGSKFTGTYDGASLCMGFSYKMAYVAYNKSARKWSSVYNTNSAKNIIGTSTKPGDLKPGDIVRTTQGGGHNIMIIKVSTKKIWYADANGFSDRKIRWNNSMSRNSLRNMTIYVKRAPSVLWKTTKNIKAPNYNDYFTKLPNSKKVKVVTTKYRHYDNNLFNAKSKIKPNTTVEVKKVVFSYDNVPRFQLKDGTYITAYKRYIKEVA